MTIAALRVPRQPPLPSPAAWFTAVGMPGGAWPNGATRNVVDYNGTTYIGFLDPNGVTRVAAFNQTTGAIIVSPAIVTGLTADLHSAPGVLVRSSDGKIVIACNTQTTDHMYVAISSNPEDVTSWGVPVDIASSLAGGGSYTYATLFQLSGESGKIYLFYAGGTSDFTLNYSTSTDGGSTWSSGTEVYANSGHYTYWTLDSDSESRIDFAVSNGTVAVGDAANLYHFYYEGGSYYKSDGTLISASLPLAPGNLTEVYSGSTNGGVRLPYSMVAAGGPYVVFAAGTSAGWAANPENYWYAQYSGGTWTTNEIDDAGTIPNLEMYEGGVALDPTSPGTTVYVAKSNGTVYQLWKYVTSNGGTSWAATQLTFDTSPDMQNYHPIAPFNATGSLKCLWSGGSAIPYPPPIGGFSAQIRGYPNPEAPF